MAMIVEGCWFLSNWLMKVAWDDECARFRNTLHIYQVGLEYVEEGCRGKRNMTSIFSSAFLSLLCFKYLFPFLCFFIQGIKSSVSLHLQTLHYLWGIFKHRHKAYQPLTHWPNVCAYCEWVTACLMNNHVVLAFPMCVSTVPLFASSLPKSFVCAWIAWVNNCEYNCVCVCV